MITPAFWPGKMLPQMGLADLIFPKDCLECGTAGYYICSKCVGKVAFSKQVCIECEKPSVDGFTHFRCIKPWGFNGSISIWNYSGVVRLAIGKLKYRFAFQIADELAAIASNIIRRDFRMLSKSVVLVPIPLHTSRKNWRGFNQSEEVGKLIAQNVGWRTLPNLILRKKQTSPQMGLTKKKRKENLKSAFGFNENYVTLPKKYPQIILFDDVLTTGSTLKEAGMVLKRKGFENVWGLTIAR